MLNIGQLIADRYELLKQLGRGGFSEVWLAQDTLAKIEVAIKIYAPGTGLDDAGISLFTQEFSLVFDMNHTNLLHPTYYDCWERMPYLILPYCRKGSAFKYLVGKNKITETEAWHLLRDIAEGLAYLHAKNPPVIHQDIKPDNILINDEDRYMITDFGISARIRSTLCRNHESGISSGTLAYMGPERFSPSPAPIMASDIWSLGATLFELLTGIPPYGEHGGLLQKNGADIPLIQTEYSQPLKRIVYNCLALNTWERPTAKQIADYARQYLDGNIPLSEVPQPPSEYRSVMPSLETEMPEPLQEKEKRNSKIKQPLFQNQQKKFFMVGIFIGVCLLTGLMLRLCNGGEPEPKPEPVVCHDEEYLPIVREGEQYEQLGNLYRHEIDSLFEDYFIDALGKYRQASFYRDSISEELYTLIENNIAQVEKALDSAYHVFLNKRDTMRLFEQPKAAGIFDNRARKTEPYILPIINNENEDETIR